MLFDCSYVSRCVVDHLLDVRLIVVTVSAVIFLQREEVGVSIDVLQEVR